MCAGAGAILAMASDLRYGTPRAKVAFLFVRVGLAGCDMGACAMLPRIIGQGRAAELLYTGPLDERGEEGAALGLLQPLVRAGAAGGDAQLAQDARRRARPCAHAHDQEDAAPGMDVGVDEAIETEAQAQAICMQTKDFQRAYEAFVGEAEARLRGRLMDRFAHYDWPFFEAAAREARARGRGLGAREPGPRARRAMPTRSASAWCRTSAAPAICATAVTEQPDVRSIAVLREMLAYHAGLADFAFAMQGLGSGPIALAGSDALKKTIPAAGRAAARRSPRSRCPSPRPAPTSRR